MIISIVGFEEAVRKLNRFEKTFDGPFQKTIGATGVIVLKRHYRDLDATEKNKLGGKKQHFWRGVGDTVQNAVVTTAEAVIAINHPVIAYKFTGGDIEHKEKQWLTIPRTADAYGKSARTYETGGKTERRLIFLKFSEEDAGLFERGKDHKLKIVYALKRRVTQSKFERTLPPEENFQSAFEEAADSIFEGLA